MTNKVKVLVQSNAAPISETAFALCPFLLPLTLNLLAPTTVGARINP